MKRLEVVYNGWGDCFLLGTLADDGRQLLFEYSQEALRQALELSPVQLPLRATAFGDFPAHQHRLPGLVADSLPDGWGLLLMDRVFLKAGLEPVTVSPLDRLAFVGDRAIGALTFRPPQDIGSLPDTIDLGTLAREIRTIVEGGESDALRELALLGSSPHGARPKVLVYHDPQARTVSTNASRGAPWIIKFQSAGEHPEVCALEALYARLAHRCGIEMPETRHFDINRKLAAFGIARFDVEVGLRVPVHSMAGLMHADFRQPSIDYVGLLRVTRLMSHDEREVRKAFVRAVFNVVFHNRDDHAKNFSFRLDRERRWKLAPGYDLSFSQGPSDRRSRRAGNGLRHARRRISDPHRHAQDDIKGD